MVTSISVALSVPVRMLCRYRMITPKVVPAARHAGGIISPLATASAAVDGEIGLPESSEQPVIHLAEKTSHHTDRLDTSQNRVDLRQHEEEVGVSWYKWEQGGGG